MVEFTDPIKGALGELHFIEEVLGTFSHRDLALPFGSEQKRIFGDV